MIWHKKNRDRLIEGLGPVSAVTEFNQWECETVETTMKKKL